MYLVNSNVMVGQVSAQELGQMPAKPGPHRVLLRGIATIEDGADITAGCVLVAGRRAVGILVDEATVEVENIHTQMLRYETVARAVRRGNQETAVPRLLAMLCILAVFVPSFFMEGAACELFVPLSLAVGFAMIASYFLSSTFVPVMCVWLLRPVPEHAAKPGPLDRLL